MTRSKRTGKMPLDVKSKKIADYSEKEKIVTAPKQTSDGRYYIEVISVSKTSPRKKRVYALSAKALRGYAILETVKGKDFFQCVYFGAKCTKDFWKRFCGYRIGARRSAKYKISVSFYEKKRI